MPLPECDGLWLEKTNVDHGLSRPRAASGQCSRRPLCREGPLKNLGGLKLAWPSRRRKSSQRRPPIARSSRVLLRRESRSRSWIRNDRQPKHSARRARRQKTLGQRAHSEFHSKANRAPELLRGKSTHKLPCLHRESDTKRVGRPTAFWAERSVLPGRDHKPQGWAQFPLIRGLTTVALRVKAETNSSRGCSNQSRSRCHAWLD